MNPIYRKQLFWVSLFTFLVFGLLCLFAPTFSSSHNLHNITRNAAFIALMAVGQSWVLLTGGIDLSVGSVMGLAGVSTALAMNSGNSIYVGIAVGLLVALTCGLINGVLIAYFSLSAFVVTLALLSIARSVCMILSDNQMIYEFGQDQEMFLAIGSNSVLGVSNIVLITLLLVLFSSVVLKYLQLGRNIYAVGGSEDAALRQGVKVKKIKLHAYCFSALCAGIAGILSLSWLGTVDSGVGNGYELPVIAAAVLSGISLKGGEGLAWSPLVGAFLIELLRNGMLLLGIGAFWQGTVVGLVLIGAICVDRIFSNKYSQAF